MPSLEIRVKEQIRAGLQEYSQGRLENAKEIFAQALSLQADHPQAAALLGVTLLALGEPEPALTNLAAAARTLRNDAWVIGNLAQAYFACARYKDAEDTFRKAQRLDPAQPQWQLGIANAIAMQGRLAEAESLLRRLTQRYADNPFVWFNLGNVLRDQARFADAIGYYTKALEVEPKLIDARNNLGSALHSEYRFEDAKREYRACLALDPDYDAARLNLASALIDNGEFSEGESVCRELVARAPEATRAHTFLGAALNHQGKLRAALDHHRIAATLAPNDPHCAPNLAGALASVGEIDSALREFERAFAMQPGTDTARYERASVLLSAGRYAEGWADYAFRPAYRYARAAHPEIEFARELPPNLVGERITILQEQGLGDEIFLLRFAQALHAAGAHLSHRTNRKLLGMLARVGCLAEVTLDGGPLPGEGRVMLVGDLPHAISRYVATARANTSRDDPLVMQADASGVMPETPPPLRLTPLAANLNAMRARLAALGDPPYIGVTWRGGTAPRDQRLGADWGLYKEIGITHLATALRDVPGTILVLQRRPLAAEIEQFARQLGRPVHDLSAANEDLEDMLALLALIDDYAGVSNTNMHLRAGVERPARVLVPGPAEWRWMVAGDRSPWFPDFTIYRQSYDGDWSAALARLRDDLLASFGAAAGGRS